MPSGHERGVGQFAGTTMEHQHGGSRGQQDRFDVMEAERTQTQPQRLHERFLGREPSSEALRGITTLMRIGALTGREGAFLERRRTRQDLTHPRHVDSIDANPDDVRPDEQDQPAVLAAQRSRALRDRSMR